LFATHPSVKSRVDALVKFAGGHDPGPLPSNESEERDRQPEQQDTPPPLPTGPWSDSGKPADATPGTAPSPSGTPVGNPMGPWGRH
jgi:heat shock protein HtpX